MSWVRLEDNVMDHPKVIALSAVALRVWLRAICHCNQHDTGGFVSDRILTRIGCTPKIRSELITPPTGYEFGLFEDAAGGLSVHDYAQYQTQHTATKAESGRQGGIKSGETRRRNASKSAATRAESVPNSDATQSRNDDNSGSTQVEKGHGSPLDKSDNRSKYQHSREANSEAKNEARARAPVPSRPVPSQDPPNPLPGERGEPSAEQEPERPSGVQPIAASALRMYGSLFVDTYTQTVLAAVETWSFPTKQRGTVERVIAAHCPPERRANPERWLAETLRAFLAVSTVHPTLWGSHGPDGFERWLNGGRPAAGVRPGPSRPEPITPQYERFEHRPRTEPIGEPPPSPAKAGAR